MDVTNIVKLTGKVFIPDTACKFHDDGRKWQYAAVQCRKKDITAGKCASCGFNPEVKLDRLAKMVGYQKATEVVQFSESLRLGG